MTDVPNVRGEYTGEYMAPDEPPDTPDLTPTHAVLCDGPGGFVDDDQPPEEEDEPARYEPREGVDYIHDFYALVDVPRDASPDTIRGALDSAIRKYHPDRVDDLAQEFRERAAVVGPLLLRARTILRDPARRADYDQLLREWQGPVSTDGTPVVTLDRMIQVRAAMLDEARARLFIDEVDRRINALLGFDPTQLEAAQRMADKYPEDPDVQAGLEAQLLEYDRLLALREVKRREMAGGDQFGIAAINEAGYRVGLGYAGQVAREIEGARVQRLSHERWLAVGGVAARLAISGSEQGSRATHPTDLLPTGQTEAALPPIFETATNEIIAIAAQRETVLLRRLDNLRLTYPTEEVVVSNNVIIGFGDAAAPTWIGFSRSADSSIVDELILDEETRELLAQGNFAELAARGYGIVRVPLLEQVDPSALLDTVINRYYWND